MNDGAVMDARMDAAARDVTGEDGRIDVALPCGSCGYQLTGLRVNDVCSECGHPIERSLRPDRWAFCSPRLVAGLRLGLSLLAVSFAIGAAVPIVRVVTNVMAARLLGPGGPTTVFYRVHHGIGLILELAVGIPLIIGVCLITRRGMHPGDDRRTWWPATRWLAPIDVGFGVLLAINILIAPSLLFASLGPLFWVGHILSSAVVVLVLLLLRDVAGRIPAPGMGRQLATVMWTYLVLAVVGLGWQITFMFLARTLTPVALGSIAMIASATLTIIPIAIFAWLAILTMRLGGRIRPTLEHVTAGSTP